LSVSEVVVSEVVVIVDGQAAGSRQQRHGHVLSKHPASRAATQHHHRRHHDHDHHYHHNHTIRTCPCHHGRAPQGEKADAMGGCYRCVSGWMTGETTGMLAIGCRTFDGVVGDMESLAQRPAPQRPSAQHPSTRDHFASPRRPPHAATRPSTRPAHMSSRQPSRGPGRGDVAESSRRAAGRCGMHLCSQDEAMARCKDANSCTTCSIISRAAALSP
jgi:hypothetical protein